MANYKEIVTKAVLGKGKKVFSNEETLAMEIVPSTVLGCWVINHNFKGYKKGNTIKIEGSYDVNIWYAYDNDTKTNVVKDIVKYVENVNIRQREETELSNEEIIIRSLKDPNCVKVNIIDNKIKYIIEKELGIEVVGDTKIKILIDESEEPWEEIIDEKEVEQEINDSITEDFIEEE